MHNPYMLSQQELVQKYNRPAPRYTSYPPVPFWINPPNSNDWISHIKNNYLDELGVDLYVHVPFCESLCYYCACNRIITKNHKNEDSFLEALLAEWQIYKNKLGFSPKINSLHFGGGTPTFLSPNNLEILLKNLLSNKSPSFIGSIEIDPRTCQKEHLEVLSQNGITRVSLGIQDFDPDVQKTINRDQSPEMVSALVDSLRSLNFSSLNFDLIYGLPKQSLKTISQTIKNVAIMKPDLIAFYSYAHLPDKIKNQRLIHDTDLPTPELKRELYESGKKLLMESGYVDVGMDHFALPTSYLYRAKKENKLHRNFMGYVDKKSSILIGLGPTSISDSSMSFVQNIKDLKSYKEKIADGELPLGGGHRHNEDDINIQRIISELMCNNQVSLYKKESLPFWEEIQHELSLLEKDGIIEIQDDLLIISPRGMGFVRNVAMAFDYHLRKQSHNTKFSQSI